MFRRSEADWQSRVSISGTDGGSTRRHSRDLSISLDKPTREMHVLQHPLRPFPAPNVMAFLSGCGEVTFAVLLVLGLATRFAGLGLLLMTLIVELTVPDAWPIHLIWAAMALAIIAGGASRLSLDALIRCILGLPARQGCH
jgi:putative oxidoreductase